MSTAVKGPGSATLTTPSDRDGALSSGMEEGLKDSYAALDRLLARLG